MDALNRYFPELTDEQSGRLRALEAIYSAWNSRINVISRKDIENFMIHHVLHSLAIAKVIRFATGSTVMDAGTGGGFPGIPLAIFFPSVNFALVDSTGKKIKVVSAVAAELGLQNVTALHSRVEDVNGKYDYVTARAVTEFRALVRLTEGKIKKEGTGEKGIICLKGGDLIEELGQYRTRVKTWNISSFYSESYFETKKVIWLPF